MEHWTGSHYTAASLRNVHVTISLGHSGKVCPSQILWNLSESEADTGPLNIHGKTGEISKRMQVLTRAGAQMPETSSQSQVPETMARSEVPEKAARSKVPGMTTRSKLPDETAAGASAPLPKPDHPAKISCECSEESSSVQTPSRRQFPGGLMTPPATGSRRPAPNHRVPRWKPSTPSKKKEGHTSNKSPLAQVVASAGDLDVPNTAVSPGMAY